MHNTHNTIHPVSHMGHGPGYAPKPWYGCCTLSLPLSARIYSMLSMDMLHWLEPLATPSLPTNFRKVGSALTAADCDLLDQKSLTPLLSAWLVHMSVSLCMLPMSVLSLAHYQYHWPHLAYLGMLPPLR